MATSWTPKLTNVRGTDGTETKGFYAHANGICSFTATVIVRKETTAASSAGFGLTLPVPAASGARYTFQLELDGRDADRGVWTGEAMLGASSDGSKIERLRVTTDANGAALQNIDHFYGDAEGAKLAEILTVTGSYPTA